LLSLPFLKSFPLGDLFNFSSLSLAASNLDFGFHSGAYKSKLSPLASSGYALLAAELGSTLGCFWPNLIPCFSEMCCSLIETLP
jgi:hypothetical protein